MGKGTTVKETPNSVATLQTLNETERVLINEANFMVDFFAEGAKTYWRLWGPLGEPMVQAVDEWAKMQRAYFGSVYQTFGLDGQ